MSGQRTSTRDIVYIALFAALTAALGLFPPIPIAFLGGVSVTAQSIGLMLAGAILGGRRGALSMLLVVGLVAVGLPLLAGGRGGLGVFAGPTAGFLVGWVPAAYVVGKLHEWAWNRLNVVTSFIFCAIGGIIVLYAIGVPWMAMNIGAPLLKVAMASSVFVIGDVIKAGIAAVIAVAIKRAYPLIERRAAIS
ncbi:biotin transporter BioY [Breoghania sp.]|uniref:biotin transporter BioY n=1 Tax=Breoghania sp. TaxID=2065378 RepID=UPI0029C9DB37|nr:biotin transporter BioY [Breoghania sp.]